MAITICGNEGYEALRVPRGKPGRTAMASFLNTNGTRGSDTIKLWLMALVIAGIFTGCGMFGKAERQMLPVPPYAPMANSLDQSYLHSPSGDIAAHYPKGWLHVDIRTISMANVEEVYTDHARRRALVLAEIPATAAFRRSVERDGMVALASQSFISKMAKASGKLALTRPTDLYTENGKVFASYEYAELGADSTRREENRVVLFTTGAKFYELGMIELVPPKNPAEHVQNFRLLEAVSASLQGVAEIRSGNDE